eukprot:2421871-Pyramimonas_sp.AAC.1
MSAEEFEGARRPQPNIEDTSGPLHAGDARGPATPRCTPMGQRISRGTTNTAWHLPRAQQILQGF